MGGGTDDYEDGYYDDILEYWEDSDYYTSDPFEAADAIREYMKDADPEFVDDLIERFEERQEIDLNDLED